MGDSPCQKKKKDNNIFIESDRSLAYKRYKYILAIQPAREFRASGTGRVFQLPLDLSLDALQHIFRSVLGLPAKGTCSTRLAPTTGPKERKLKETSIVRSVTHDQHFIRGHVREEFVCIPPQ